MRVHLGADDQGYTAMGFGADAEGVQGMYMRKHVIELAQRGLVENLRRLQPLMTPAAAKVRCTLQCQTLDTLRRECDHADMAPQWKPKARSAQPYGVLKATSPYGLHTALHRCYRCF